MSLHDDCAVCLNTMRTRLNRVVQLQPCGHYFHESCIMETVRAGHRLCPLCRSVVLGPPTIERVVQIHEEANNQIELGRMTISVANACARVYLARMQRVPVTAGVRNLLRVAVVHDFVGLMRRIWAVMPRIIAAMDVGGPFRLPNQPACMRYLTTARLTALPMGTERFSAYASQMAYCALWAVMSDYGRAMRENL